MSALISVSQASGIAMQRSVEAHALTLLKSVGNLFLKSAGKRGVHVGSGVFIRFRDREYFLTAAHVSTQQKSGQSLYVGGFGRFVALDGRWRETDDAPLYGGDPLDVGLLSIHPESRAQLNGVQFFQIDRSLTRDNYLRSNRFMVMGFPRSQNKRILSVDSLPVNARSYFANPRHDQRLPDKPYVMGRSHLVLEWDDAAAFDPNGQLVRPTPLPGVSGGPIFEMGDFADPAVLAGEVVPVPTLAGILTDYLAGKKAILGTRINVIVDALDDRRAWPEPYAPSHDL